VYRAGAPGLPPPRQLTGLLEALRCCGDEFAGSPGQPAGNAAFGRLSAPGSRRFLVQTEKTIEAITGFPVPSNASR